MIAKKMLLFSALALAAVAALAPAAGQAEWTHEGKALSGSGTFSLSGSVKLEVAGGHTYECPVLIEMTILEGAEGKGTINSYEPVAPSCKGTGAVATCQLAGTHTPFEETGPWVVDAKEWANKVIDAKATNVTFEYTFKGCLVPNAHVEFKEVTMTPDNVGQISSFTLSGSEGAPINAKISGTVFLTSKQKTYGIK